MVGLPHCSAETLSALLDGELTADERAQARAHLDSCLECGGRLVAARRLDVDLRDVGQLPCGAVLPALSAIVDGEPTLGERQLAAAHLADCRDCRQTKTALRNADRLLLLLPSAAPSRRVDAYIATLGQPAQRAAFRPVPFAFRSAGVLALAVLLAIGSTLFQAAAPIADQAQSSDVALVAAIQHVVFDARSNTLYLLDTERAEVSAVDATTQSERARVSVGGRPTALAISAQSNRVLVLDATSKRLTEIDTTSHEIVATSTLVVTGTPTSLQVDPTNGRIVVASVSAAAANAAPAASTSTTSSTGHVTFIDPVSKQVESVRAVDVAPQLVVLDAKGTQAVLLSASETTLVDAATYRSVDKLPGGVAAAFDATGGQLAVLSADGAGSKVTFRGSGLPASLSLAGRPITLIAMPTGGFAALVERGTGGEIDVIDTTGHVVSSTPVALAGHSVTYDAAGDRFAVGGDGGQGLAFSGPAPVAASVPVTIAPTPTPVVSAAPTPTPKKSATPNTPSVVLPAVLFALPPAAQLTGSGMYRLALGDNRQPTVIAGSGQRLWFVDQSRRLATIDTKSGLVVDVAQLPLDGTFTRVLLGRAYVYAIDQGLGRITILDIRTGIVETIAFSFVNTARGLSVGTDDRLWVAGGQSSNLLALDPVTKRVVAVDIRSSSISALFVDSAARVWFADDASGTVGYYDQTQRTVVAIETPNHSSVTALSMDRDGTLWAGTNSGQLLSWRSGVFSRTLAAGGSVTDLVRDDSGAVWSYVSVAAGALVYRPLTAAGGPRIAPIPASAMAFDAVGRAWLADPAGAGFYIALKAGE